MLLVPVCNSKLTTEWLNLSSNSIQNNDVRLEVIVTNNDCINRYWKIRYRYPISNEKKLERSPVDRQLSRIVRVLRGDIRLPSTRAVCF